MQFRIKQLQGEDPLQWQNLLGDEKTEDPRNIITATMKNLPPPINIFNTTRLTNL